MRVTVFTVSVWATLALLADCSGEALEEHYEEARRRMVKEQLEARDIENSAVLDAMGRVPRHLFVPAIFQTSAYADHPLPIGKGQTISQPYIVALMTELADPDPDDVVLEIGTGSGYQSAVLAEIVREVYTIEILPELFREAMARLESLGYDNVTGRAGDGYLGWPEHAPYDAILVTAAAPRIPPPLIAQLAPGGFLIVPVGPEGRVQKLLRIEKAKDGTTSTEEVIPVVFVPLVRER